MERGASGDWQVLGTAPLDGTFAERIETLRVETLVRGSGPVDLWLPADQVTVRRYALPHGLRRRSEALRRISAETGRRPHELCVAICPAPAGEPATVLAAPARTVAEARDYAGRWGFRPGRASAPPDAVGAGTIVPAFEQPGRLSSPLVAATAPRPVAAAVAAVALVAVAGWGAVQLAPDDEPPLTVNTAPVLALASVEAAPPALSTSPATRVGNRQVQSRLARPPARAEPAGLLAIAGPAAEPAHGVAAADLAEPSPGVTMRVGPAPVLPARFRPARLASAGPAAPAPIALASATDRLRRKAAEQVPPAPIILAAVTVLAPEKAPVPPVEAQGSASVATVQLAASSMAPRQVPEAPPPRPEPEPVAEAPDNADEPVSELAAASAPRPIARPRQAASAAVQRAYADDRSPAGVRQAALLRGLKMDSTALIGVLDAKSGRQALLRTSTGQFLKVGRGDSVEGWRVSAINRDAIRLTRGGQSRTLLLMVR